ncbi:unnamed protein product [marine sediment metagenome]|uniref:Abortive infection protein n=1 Tax=marine sediment metagenome TaxID=412755 RepID=X1RLQ7_9ZZZZ
MQPLPAVNSTLRKLRKTPFFVWLILGQSFIFVTAPAIAPPNEVVRLQSALTVYMILTVAFMVLQKKKLPWMQATLNQGIAWFFVGFLVTAIVFSALNLQGFNLFQLTGPMYMIVFHTLVVATSETFIFQGFLPHIITPVVAQGAFGIFHWASYLGNWEAIGIAFIAGLVFYGLAVRFNIWLACGVHAGFNIGMLGILVGGG